MTIYVLYNHLFVCVEMTIYVLYNHLFVCVEMTVYVLYNHLFVLYCAGGEGGSRGRGAEG